MGYIPAGVGRTNVSFRAIAVTAMPPLILPSLLHIGACALDFFGHLSRAPMAAKRCVLSEYALIGRDHGLIEMPLLSPEEPHRLRAS